MNSGYCPARRISCLFKSLVPLQRSWSGASNALSVGHCLHGSRGWKVGGEEVPVHVFFLGPVHMPCEHEAEVERDMHLPWCSIREPILGITHLLIRYLLLGSFFQGINPVVAHAIRKLLLLPPQHLFGQVRIILRSQIHLSLVFLMLSKYLITKGLPQDSFFDPLCSAHLCLWIQVHGILQELTIQEWNASFDTP